MNILDYLLLILIFLWLVLVLVLAYKKKKAGRCIGCSGGNCTICNKKVQK